MSLDGTDDYVSVPNSANLNPTGAITLEAWVKPTAGAFSTVKPILLKGYAAHADPYYQYGLFLYDSGSSKLIRLALSIGGVFNPTDVTFNWSYGVWQHIVGTWDGSTARIYLNGSQVGSATRTGTISTYATPLTVGCFHNLPKTSDYCFKGVVDEAAVYPSALSAARVQVHYDDGVTPPNTSPPESTSPPTVSGTTTERWTLTATTGTWANDPTSYAYQWRRCDAAGASCADIGGATAPSYVLTGADVGKTVRVSVTATNAYGSTSASSAPTAAVEAIPPVYPPLRDSDCGQVKTLNGPYVSGYKWECASDLRVLWFQRARTGGWEADLYECVPTSSWPWSNCGTDAPSYDGGYGGYYSFRKEAWAVFGEGSTAGGNLVLTQAALNACGVSADGEEIPCYARRWYANGVPPGLLRGDCTESEHANNPGACVSDPVQGASAGFRFAPSDLQLPGVGVPFRLTRNYNSEDPSSSAFGRGWSFSYGARLEFYTTGDIVFHAEDGQVLIYVRQPDGTFTAAGALSTLAESGGGYDLVRRDQVRYRFDSGGRLTSIRDRNGQGLTFVYNANGGLATITDSGGRSIAVTTSAEGRITGVELADGRNVQYGYTSGRLTSVTDVRGGTTTYSYDSDGRLTKIVDANTHTLVENTYVSGGRVVEQLDPLGRRTTFSWDPTTETLTTTDARGKAWKDVYSKNRLVKRIDPLGNTTEYGYDANFNLTSVKDARGNTTTMTYDSRGNLLTRTPPAPFAFQEVFTYDPQNNLLTARNARGFTTTYEYDTAGNLIRKTKPGNVVTEYGRDLAGTGLLKSITDPRGKITRFEHDAQGNLTAAIAPSGAKTTMTYDASGRRLSHVDPRGNVAGASPNDYRTTFTYDAADHVRTQTDPLANVTEWQYDAVGNVSKVIDAKNRATEYRYDGADRLDKVIAPDTTVTDYDYDAVGNMTTRTDANLHTTSFGYDDASRLTSVLSPKGQRWIYEYDGNGNRTKMVDANGNTTAGDPLDGTTAYAYDELNRVTGIDYSDTTPDVSFAYDHNGNPTQMSDGAGTQTYSYDNLDRLTGVVRGSDSFSYAYDPAGNVTRRTYPGTRVTDYTYTDDNELETVTSVGQTTYHYEAGYLTRTELPAGSGYVETRTYDRAGRLTEVRNAKAGATLSASTYAYDQVSNPTSVTTPTDITTYDYDLLDRLKEVCFAASCAGPSDPFIRYTYDPVGNRATEARPGGTTTYTYNVADQLISASGPAGAMTYGFDENGNQTQAGSRAFTYDLANRLRTTTGGGETITYAYDGLGTRLRATSGSLPSQQTSYLWDVNGSLPALALERDGVSATRRAYVHGRDVVAMDVPVALGVGDQRSYYQYDGLGNVVNVTSASGAAQWSYAYEPFGSNRSEVKHDLAAPDNLMRFAGELYDATIGLYHLRARQYDPATGRFLGTDPLPPFVTDPYVSTYVYGGNRPTVLVDPSGMGAVWADTCTSAACWLEDLWDRFQNGTLTISGCVVLCYGVGLEGLEPSAWTGCCGLGAGGKPDVSPTVSGEADFPEGPYTSTGACFLIICGEQTSYDEDVQWELGIGIEVWHGEFQYIEFDELNAETWR